MNRLSNTYTEKDFTNINLISNKEATKYQGMLSVINKAVSKDSSSYCRNHVPVYGWVKMNYPSTINRSLYHQLKENQTLENVLELPLLTTSSNHRSSNLVIKYKSEYGEEIILNDKLKYRKDPNFVNEEVMKESKKYIFYLLLVEGLIKTDHTLKFMNNYKATDLNFFRNAFSNFNIKKRNLEIDDNFPHNYNRVIENGSKLYLYELGYKKAFAFLKTDSYSQKCEYIDANLFFDKKYSTMYPKNCILGPDQDKEYSKKCKKIGDISFDESTRETETLKNMSRLPPEYISEEWLKININNTIELLKIDNCYWLSFDFISKIGRLDENLKELSLRNLEINNAILTNILKYAKKLEILDISNCKGLSIGICENIFTCAKNLKSLKLSKLKEVVTDGGLEKISSILTLEELDISLCSQITSSGLASLAKNKNNILTSLDLTGLLCITNEAFCKVVSRNSNSLLKLRASLLPQKSITGEICNEISKCKNLTHLDLSGCINLDINNLNSIFNLGKLESVNFSGIYAVDDDLAINLISSNRNLKILRLSNCVLISSNFLDYVINMSNSLILVEINRTPKISDAKIEETILKKTPNLRIIRATNIEWDLKNIGYKIPLPPKEISEIKAKGKNEKNPINQLKKLIEENKPKRIWDIMKK